MEDYKEKICFKNLERLREFELKKRFTFDEIDFTKAGCIGYTNNALFKECDLQGILSLNPIKHAIWYSLVSRRAL